MADNYLERAMEDLKSGRLVKSNIVKATNKRGNPRHIYIKDIEAFGIENVRELVRDGVKVSFSFPDGHIGSKLARTLKCFYRPIGMGRPEDAEEYNEPIS